MGTSRNDDVQGQQAQGQSAPGRGPLGYYDAEQGLCGIADNPGPLGVQDRGDPTLVMPQPQVRTRVDILLLDLAQVTRFLRSVAMAKSMAMHTQLQWEEYNESTVLNAIYALMPWKGQPGWVSVKTPDSSVVERETTADANHFFDVFMTKLSASPGSARDYLKKMEEIRSDCLQTLRQCYGEAQKINQAVVQETGEAIRTLAAIKFTTDLIMKSKWAGPVGLAYGMSTALIKEWYADSGPAMVAFKVGMEPAKEGVKAGLEKGANLSKLEGRAFQSQLERSEELAQRYERQLEGKLRGKKMRNKARQLEKVQKEAAAARQGVRGAKLASGLFKGLTVGFIAFDVYDSVSDLADAWNDSAH